MTGPPGRILGAAAVLAAALAAVAVPAASARPDTTGRWTAGACPTAAGVTVVVDFQQLQDERGATRESIVRCAPGSPSSGFDALTEAGISFTQVSTNGGFLCKIEGLPAGAKYANGCSTIPPTSAYWGYWVATRGGAWCYSRVGAGNRAPKQGTVEGWSFSTGKPEGGTPPRPAVPGAVSGAPGSIDDGSCPSPPTTTTTAPRPVTTAPSRTDTPGTTGRAAGGDPSGTGGQDHERGGSGGATAGSTGSTAGDSGAAGDGASTTSSSASASTTTTSGGGGEVLIRSDGSGGSPAGAIGGGAAVAGLGLAAALIARRRRRAPDEDRP